MSKSSPRSSVTPLNHSLASLRSRNGIRIPLFFQVETTEELSSGNQQSVGCDFDIRLCSCEALEIHRTSSKQCEKVDRSRRCRLQRSDECLALSRDCKSDKLFRELWEESPNFCSNTNVDGIGRT